MSLKRLEHCLCTNTMTNIRSDRDSSLIPPGYKPQSIRMSQITGKTIWQVILTSDIFDALKRDAAQWLERGALSMSLHAVQFWTPLGAEFSKKYHVSPLSILSIVSMLCFWTGHVTRTCFTWLTCECVPGRTEMAMCTVSSMRRNGCRTASFTWSWYGTRMSWSNDQQVQWPGGRMKSQLMSLKTWYQTINAPLYLCL